MQKFFRVLAACLAMFSLAVFILAGYAEIRIPDSITTVEEKDLMQSDIFHFTPYEKVEAAGTQTNKEVTDDYEVNVSLFNVIPLKKTKVTAGQRRYVTLCGTIYGIKLYSSGVVVISTEDIETDNGRKNPGEEAGIKSGDIIKKINNKKVNSNREVSEICKNSNGKELEFTIERKGKTISLTLRTVKEKVSGSFKAGLWVRDSTAGIGTMTFYDRETGIFASLGHAICDIDTGITLPLSEGTAVKARILGCVPGTDSEAGELTGAFMQDDIGRLYMNSECGVYGKLYSYDTNALLFPVAVSSEIRTGKAQILCTVDGSEPQYYDVEITKITDNKSHQKNMTVKITDERLLEITGGIVQGMSGTPLIQDGKFVGAITHVFVGTPKEGYAIFAENMLAAADEVKEKFDVKKVS
ncbi:MAG: SpoIVB peptidase [Clostridia bacterium]|nr:SpoIVB peptidase [Clostridia bacterium]